MPVLGAPTQRAHISSALEANLRKGFVERYNIVSKDLKYPKIYDVMGSDQKTERFAVYAGFGTFSQKSEGAAPDYDSPQEAWNKALTANQFMLGAQVTRVALEDDLHGILKQSLRGQGSALIDVAMYTKERDALDLFNSYLTSGTAYTAGGTGYPVLSTTHFRVDGDTWSNKPAASIDFSIEALEYAITHWMANQKNQRGQIVRSLPTTLMVAPADAMLAYRVVKSMKYPTSSNNDPNPAGDMISEIIVHPLMTNDGRWLLFGPKSERKLPYIERVKPGVERLPDGDNLSVRYVARYREAHGLVSPENLWGSD